MSAEQAHAVCVILSGTQWSRNISPKAYDEILRFRHTTLKITYPMPHAEQALAEMIDYKL